MESTSREEFIRDISPGGRYSSIAIIWRRFASVNITGRLDAELAPLWPKTLKAICHTGAGYDHIDIAPLTECGIQVSNITDAVVPGTADTNLYLMLGALRNFSFCERVVRNGGWIDQIPLAHDPRGKVLGILGMGGIGRAVRDRAIPLNFDKIVYYNRSRLSPELEKGAEYVSDLDKLYEISDVVNINCPLNKETHHLIDATALAKMKKGVVIVNTARGAIIDEQALVDALETGHVRSVGLDVFEHEPRPHPKLLTNENVVIVPHAGTHAVESRTDMEMAALENVISFIKTGKLITPVPEQRGLF
ncbi:hypothetical protein NADFUDRAFT_69982 [Nadsonia fulvescens var. elongata DSM 6958]|uniref:Glyoxylate reductase n=1 Tax=Nadsonia fulvescens var. elongata DSM 6958 TaxID=857566 RepID=A0A1E3PJZ8_9ASCO|nr:hypothetical protein NADFUDRAFT_69982 [Nadsonia fulvescens var. elongata DSM 6958]